MLEHGIDLHKRTLVIARVDRDGRLIRRRKIPARRSTLRHYFNAMEGPHRAVVEATGSWYWVSDLLRQQGVELELAHARQLKAVASAKVKSDAVDALTLAQLLRADLIPEAHMISPELRGYRDLLRTRLNTLLNVPGEVFLTSDDPASASEQSMGVDVRIRSPEEIPRSPGVPVVASLTLEPAPVPRDSPAA